MGIITSLFIHMLGSMCFSIPFPLGQLKLLVGKFFFPGQKSVRQADGCCITSKEKYRLENLKWDRILAFYLFSKSLYIS